MESPYHNRSQVSIGVQIYKSFLKLRVKRAFFYISYLFSFALAFVSYAMKFEISYYYYRDYDFTGFHNQKGFPRSVQKTIYTNYRTGELNPIPNVYVWPETELVINTVRSCFQMNAWNRSSYQYDPIKYPIFTVQTRNKLGNLVSKDIPSYGFMVNYDIDKMIFDIHIIERTDEQVRSPEIFELCMQWYLANYTGNNMTTNMYGAAFPHPRDILLAGTIATSLFFHVGYLLVVFLTIVSIFELNESKLSLLLRINGARRFTLWFSILMVDATFLIPYIFIISGIFKGSILFTKTSYGIILVNIFFTMISVFAQALFFSLIFRHSKHIKYLFLLLFSISVCFSILTGLEVLKNIPRAGCYTLMSFFPQLSSCFVFENCEFARVQNISYSFANIRDSYTIETPKCYLFMFISFMIYFVLYIVIANRDILFDLTYWKNRFRVDIDSYEFTEDESQVAIGVRKICKTYRSKSQMVKAVDDVSFKVDTGEIILLIGPNGSGKTTLINAMTGMIDADSGSLDLFGRTRSSFANMQDYIGICTQENIIFDQMSVFENLQLFGSIRGCPVDKLCAEIEKLAHSLSLSDCLDLKAGTLSGGQKRKLCIALAFIGNPPIVILDEPTCGIDVSTRQIIWKTISAFSSTTSFISSHMLEEAESVCSRIFVMSNGKMIFQGTASDLRQENNCGYLFKIIGDEVNTDKLLKYIRKKIPQAQINKERNDIINIPVSDKVASVLEHIDKHKEKFHITDFTMTAEAIEDVLLRLISADEN